jgi:DNA-binding MarR family transcriptional regulator
MKLGEDALPADGFGHLAMSVRSVLIDVIEHPGSAIGQIAERTGFPQSHVSASVDALRDGGAVTTTTDPDDRRRTLVRVAPEIEREAATRLSSASLDGAFDTVLDCGLLHTLADDVVPRFIEAVRSVLRPGGVYHLLCISDRQPGHAGPRRVSQSFIRTAFADGWRVDAIDAATLEVTMHPGALQAWQATITRR